MLVSLELFVVFIGEGGLSSIVVFMVGNGIPLCHSHNVKVVPLSTRVFLCVPTMNMPLNGARLPVAFLSNTAIVSPFLWRVVGSYRIIS